MKIFISHAWKNKTAAQLIAESLQNTTDVWLDIRQLKAGDRIQQAIDKALAEMDVVVVLWSKDAATSDGVDAEVRTAVRLGKRVLPVLLDETPLDSHPSLRELYGIDFSVEDARPGLFRIQAALLRLMVGPLDPDAAEALKRLTSFEGSYAYVQGYRNRREIGGEDSADWALRSMEQCNEAYKSLSDLRDRTGETLKYLQDTLAKVQAAGADRAAIQAVLNEVIRNPKSDTRELKVLIAFIEGKLSSLSVGTTPAAGLRRDAPGTAQAFAREVEQKGPPPGPKDAARVLVESYIRSAPVSLNALMRLAAVLPSLALKHVANELLAYLNNPDDLIPDDQNGIFGFIDDAWLIHNTIYRCIEAGIFSAQDIGIEWGPVAQADALVVQALPPRVRTTLEQLLMQLLRIIGNENMGYQPQFMMDAGNSYGAYMGAGAAVGGASTGPQSVDDLFVSGGQVTWVGKTW